MPGIKSLLDVDKKETPVIIGVVSEVETGGRLKIKVGNKTYRATTGIETDIYYIGDRVILAITDDGVTVVGRDKLKPRERKTVIIEG